MKPIPRILEGWLVLVVDDEQDSLEVAQRLLKLAGASVMTATNGQEALARLREQPPEQQARFILSDLSMPEMNGWALLSAARQDPALMHIPVIALTAHAMTGDRDKALEAGFHNYISKPLDPTKFIERVVAVLTDIPDLAALLHSD